MPVLQLCAQVKHNQHEQDMKDSLRKLNRECDMEEFSSLFEIFQVTIVVNMNDLSEMKQLKHRVLELHDNECRIMIGVKSSILIKSINNMMETMDEKSSHLLTQMKSHMKGIVGLIFTQNEHLQSIEETLSLYSVHAKEDTRENTSVDQNKILSVYLPVARGKKLIPYLYHTSDQSLKRKGVPWQRDSSVAISVHSYPAPNEIILRVNNNLRHYTVQEADLKRKSTQETNSNSDLPIFRFTIFNKQCNEIGTGNEVDEQ